MKIYTKTGDRGDTRLFDGAVVRKHNDRVAAYGEVDEHRINFFNHVRVISFMLEKFFKAHVS
jgi:cob(I)alamin adenosyltransferase